MQPLDFCNCTQAHFTAATYHVTAQAVNVQLTADLRDLHTVIVLHFHLQPDAEAPQTRSNAGLHTGNSQHPAAGLARLHDLMAAQ